MEQGTRGLSIRLSNLGCALAAFGDAVVGVGPGPRVRGHHFAGSGRASVGSCGFPMMICCRFPNSFTLTRQNPLAL